MPKPNPIIPYNPKLKELAKELRNNPTPAESIVWDHLRKKQMKGYEFHRQVPALGFIMDFYCHEWMLAIELDGSSHDFYEIEDSERQRKIEAYGVAFLRFTNKDVFNNIDQVIKKIKDWIIKQESAR